MRAAARLGIPLLAVVAAAYVTGIIYLPGRLGGTSVIPAPALDVLHLYSGLGGAAVLVVKVVVNRSTRSRPPADPRDGYLTVAMAILLALSFATGFLALAPLGARLHSAAINAHLLTSIWAAVPLTIHVLRNRRRLGAAARRARPLAAAALVLAPGVFLAAGLGVAASDAAIAGVSGQWSAPELSGLSLGAFANLPDGRHLAAGDGLYVGGAGGGRWRSVALPSGNPEVDRLVEIGIRPGAASVPTPGADAGAHGSHSSAAVVGGVTALAVTPAGGHVYVGTDEGLYFSPWADGPYVRLPYPGTGVRALAVDPGNPYVLWVAGAGGPWLTIDGGHSWSRLAGGLTQPDQVSTLVWTAGGVYGSDLAGVERWNGEAWTRTADIRLVTTLVDDGRGGVVALSHQAGIFRLARGTATPLTSGAHQHGSAPGHAYLVAGGQGVLAAMDGGSRVTVARPGGGWVAAGTVAGTDLLATDGRRLYALGPGGVRTQEMTPGAPIGAAALLALAAMASVAAAGSAAMALRCGVRVSNVAPLSAR